MKWIFGNTFICRDAETAKRVTFANDIRLKSVTFDGDVYDPHGTLSGGSKPHSAGILVKIQEMAELREEIDMHQRRLKELNQELDQAQQTITDYKTTKQRLDLQTHQLSLLEKRIEQSKHAQVILMGYLCYMYQSLNCGHVA